MYICEYIYIDRYIYVHNIYIAYRCNTYMNINRYR